MRIETFNRVNINDQFEENVCNKTFTKTAPIITLDHDEVAERHDVEAAVVDVEDSEGKQARFWVAVTIKNGRPIVRVTTKIAKGDKETTKTVTGTFNRI